MDVIDAGSYVSHELHRAPRSWGESNCYIDVWIEVLHALGCEPFACLPFVISIDWEGDQFTFFKPPLEDLFELYGVDVQELTVYKPLLDNALVQIEDGKIVLSEADAYFLPDTAGTDYRTNHVKTTIGIHAVDLPQRTLGYFHNAGYHALHDVDFAGLFRLDSPPDPAYMPFFAELVRTRRVVKLEPRELVRRSIGLLRKHLVRRPHDNPIQRFARAFAADIDVLQRRGLAAYHLYAFATIRQLGAAFELGAAYLRWLGARGVDDVEPAAVAFDGISTTSKALILKAARAVGARKPMDVAPMLHDIAARWDVGMRHLGARML